MMYRLAGWKETSEIHITGEIWSIVLVLYIRVAIELVSIFTEDFWSSELVALTLRSLVGSSG
jgi:hypothetical protein